MRSFTTLFAFALLFFVDTVVSQSTLKNTLTLCRTRLGGTSGQKPSTVSKSYAFTRTLTVTSTTTPIVTVTPAPVTSTTTATSTVWITTDGPGPTFTVTSTAILTKTATKTASTTLETLIVTVSATTTSSVTTTVTFSANVTPIQSTIPGAMAKKRSTRFIPERRQETSPNPATALQSGSSYPKTVYCNIITKAVVIVTIIKQAPAKTTTLAPSTVLSTTTTTVTNTRVIVPPGGSYVTVITTSFTTTTATITPARTTTTTTSISTVIAAIATAYPQCDAPNRASKVNGVPISGYFAVDNRGFSADYSSISDPRQCCISCLEDPDCGASDVFPEIGAPYCLMINPNGGCDPSNPLRLVVSTDANADRREVLSNGKCANFIQ